MSSFAMYAAKARREVLLHRDIAHDVERAAAPFAREVAHPPALQLREPFRLGDLERLPARLHRRLLEVGRGVRAPLRIAIRGEAHRAAHLHQLAEDLAGVQAVSVGHRELHGERPGRHLRPHVRAPRQTFLVQAERFEMLARRRREQGVGERAGDAGLPLVNVRVGALLTGGDEHHTFPRVARREEERLHFVRRREAARDGFAVDAAVREREAGREARRTRRERLPHEHAHLPDLVRCGDPLVGGVAHHVEPHRGVTDVRGEVEERSPGGRRARGTRGTWRTPTRYPRSASPGPCPRRSRASRRSDRGARAGSGRSRSRSCRRRRWSRRGNTTAAAPDPRRPARRSGCGCR